MTGRLFDKVWDRHVVASPAGEPPLLYIDLHLVHEVTSPQAFEALELAGRPVRRPDLTLATMDHDVPTTGQDQPIADELAAAQISRLRRNCEVHDVTLHALGSLDQGIVHVIGPQLGLTQPGMTVVCGDSHTSTHGAFGALAFGIGTTEVEHVLATQTLRQVKPAAMAVTVDGDLPPGLSAKDLVLGIIRTLGPGGGTGSVIEYRGDAIRALSMEGRMTVCNMSIEAGARAGLIGSGRHHVRLAGRAQAQSGGQALGAGARRLAEPGHRRRRGLRPRDPDRRHGAAPGHHLGDHARPVSLDRRRHPRSGRAGQPRPSSRRPAGRWPTWGWSQERRSGTSAWTPSSSARAPTGA